MNRPEAALSWCQHCNDWTAFSKPGRPCLWCDNKTVGLEFEEPDKWVPVDERYPNLKTRVFVQPTLPSKDSLITVQNKKERCSNGHVYAVVGTLRGVKNGKEYALCRMCRSEQKKRSADRKKAANGQG